MESSTVVAQLYALAQESRLAIFRLLVAQGSEGLCVGEIADRLKLPAATLSFHLKELSHAGLLTARQQGRFIYYAPDFSVMQQLMGYLTENCCGGQPCEVACMPTQSSRKRA